MRLLAIIPAYNEAGTIGDVILRIKHHHPSMDILVVNDGSTDSTSEAARLTGAVSVLELPFNLGIGGAVQAGYRYAWKKKYDLAVQIDADGQHDPAELERILSPVMSGEADCCIGSRFLEMLLTIVMSRMHRRIVRLAQEVAILKEELGEQAANPIIPAKGGAVHG
ncbi:MAG: glycosyltransferase family 2 protein [Paenibacillaceae bacterium]|jgi:glycosyltransferase involved in cell wall biosynthesis|nr:glycosyltransferase family 2 protein [Paenibacillaceae bacterium]